MHDRAIEWRLGAILLATVASTMLAAIPAAAAAEPEVADHVENSPIEVLGGEPTLRASEALLTRHADHLEFEIHMDTPEPGSYVYPPAVPDVRKAAPEVFTAWAFVFNRPQHCLGSEEWAHCGADDFSEQVRSGVYGVAGHVSSVDHEGGAFILDRGTGGQIVLRGRIEVGDAPWPDLPPGATTFPLENPLGAEVHVAIAPHGQLDPATVATELYAPAGDPTCGCWWVSFFGLHGFDESET